MQKDLPVRKRIRLEGYDYSRPGYYFITICTKNRHCLFGNIIGDQMRLNDYGSIAENELLKISSRYSGVEIDNHVIMPNHVHMIIVIKPTERINAFPTADIPNIVGKYKAGVTRIVGNAFMRSVGMRSEIWQSRFHDHIIRSEEEYKKIWQYINDNPAKWRDDQFYYE